MKIGTDNFTAGYVGTDEVQKIYMGDELVWQKTSPTPPVPTPYDEQYLTVEALSAGTFNIQNENCEFSKNGGAWTWATGNQTLSLDAGDKVRFRHSTNNTTPGIFSGNTMSFKVYGNIESMEYGDNFTGQTTQRLGFSNYFQGSTGLVDAENLILPATALTASAYTQMFSGCTSLETAPELPATLLSNYCYRQMFRNCESLTTAPALPATTMTGIYCYSGMFAYCSGLTTAPELPATALTSNCYNSMFYFCSNLTSAPELPATTLASNCYQYMFAGCTSLTTAPALPATTLASNCYANMFNACTSLTTAPALPATTLANNCYLYMFWGCTSLTTAPVLTNFFGGAYANMFLGCTSLNFIMCPATASTTINMSNWVSGVSQTGTFVKAYNQPWQTGNNGIPSGWTVMDTSAYVVDSAGNTYPGIPDMSNPGPEFHFDFMKPWDATWTLYFNKLGNQDVVIADLYLDKKWECDGSIGEECEYINEHDKTISGIDLGTGEDPAPEGDSTHSGKMARVNLVCYAQGSGLGDINGIDDVGGTIYLYGEDRCQPADGCDDWGERGYESYEDCTCANYGENCGGDEPGVDCASDWESLGYQDENDCRCQEYGEDCPE